MKLLSMKYLSILIFAIGLCVTSCHHKGEPPLEINLSIVEQFVPGNVRFSMSDAEFKGKIKPWINKKIIVNSVDELPADPLGFNESFYKINFRNYTMLIYYDLHDFNVVSYSNRYFRETVDGTYNWSISLGVSGRINDGDEWHDAIVSRYAILVSKLPDDVDVRIWTGVYDKNWDWSANK